MGFLNKFKKIIILLWFMMYNGVFRRMDLIWVKENKNEGFIN